MRLAGDSEARWTASCSASWTRLGGAAAEVEGDERAERAEEVRSGVLDVRPLLDDGQAKKPIKLVTI